MSAILPWVVWLHASVLKVKFSAEKWLDTVEPFPPGWLSTGGPVAMRGHGRPSRPRWSVGCLQPSRLDSRGLQGPQPLTREHNTHHRLAPGPQPPAPRAFSKSGLPPALPIPLILLPLSSTCPHPNVFTLISPHSLPHDQDPLALWVSGLSEEGPSVPSQRHGLEVSAGQQRFRGH